jgi:hypothetical protein
MTITIEQVEALALELEQESAAQEAKLRRLIKAEARILAQREPWRFERRALEQSDEDGHWDNSYPPKIKYKRHAGPRCIMVRDCATQDIATSSGFYHDWKRVTTDPGLFVMRDGRILGCDESGTGSVGAYAAHPGDHNVQVTLDYSEREEVSLDELREVEATLRALAFPAAVAGAA